VETDGQAECKELKGLKHSWIGHWSSHMFFTSIPRYLNSLNISKDILKRISITWNCKCCNYTGPYFVRPVSLVTSQILLHGGRWRYHPRCL